MPDLDRGFEYHKIDRNYIEFVSGSDKIPGDNPYWTTIFLDKLFKNDSIVQKGKFADCALVQTKTFHELSLYFLFLKSFRLSAKLKKRMIPINMVIKFHP